MPKNIILFSDGTGNSSATLFKTNVWRLYQALDLSGPDQIAYYDDGVGTSSFKPFALLGGAFGWGLKRNVKHLYAFLSRNYTRGDRIYAFGFSRGAFTIRILIGLVYDQGLARGATEAELWQEVNAKWWAYRKRARTKILGRIRTRMFGRPGPLRADPQVKFTFVGLWDTVSAYGFPADELTRAWDQYIWPLSMNDRIPCDNVEKAFHALSIDDERNAFHPVLWTEEKEPQNATSTHLNQERISQVWFAGVHANIGGGYPDDSLAYVPLYWIINESRKRGLNFQYGKLPRTEVTRASTGRIYDSRRGLGGYYRYNPRKMTKLIDDKFREVCIDRPKIHESVFERMRSGDDRYAPFVLPEKYAVVKTDGSIVDGFVESLSQSQARAVEQERVWNWVWARRVVYFFSLISSGYLAAFPLFLKDGACASNYFCFLNLPITVVGSLLPAFAAPWLDRFKANPGWFLLGAAFLAILLFAGGRLNGKIRDEMRLIWEPFLAAPGKTVPPAQPPSDFIYWLRTRRSYQAFFHALRRHIFPLLFALGFYFLAAALTSRFTFSIFSAAGGVCVESEKPKWVDGTTPLVTFAADNPCAATGYMLQERAWYRIWIDTGEDWADNEIRTGLEGFSREKMSRRMYAGLPFRRWLAEPWFKPIARLGARGNDEYPLEPSVPFAAGDHRRRLAAEIQARRTGELFLYVNDAVFLWPWFHTYGNNKGNARVKIQRVEAPAMPNSGP